MRTMLRSKATLLFMMLGLLLAVPAVAFGLEADPTGTTSAAAPTIQSDKADYAPGELVTLTGSNWQPGESVHINVNDDQGQTWSRNVDVTADASGNISDSFNLPDWFVAQYSVTATGAQSGTATTSFTDAVIAYSPTKYPIPPATYQSVAAGSNFTYDLTATSQGGGPAQTVTGFTVEKAGQSQAPDCPAPPSGTASDLPASWVSTTGFPKPAPATFNFKIDPPTGTTPGYYKGAIKFQVNTGGRGNGAAVCVQVTAPSDTAKPANVSISIDDGAA
jgi:hypothetical protein